MRADLPFLLDKPHFLTKKSPPRFKINLRVFHEFSLVIMVLQNDLSLMDMEARLLRSGSRVGVDRFRLKPR
jgi:hypothetical protein